MTDDNTGDNGSDAVHDGASYGLTDDQRQTIDVLAKSKSYSRKSRWQVFVHLPKGQKWPYFVQQFMLPVSVAAVVLAFVVAMAVTALTREPNPELSVVSMDVNYAKVMERVRQGFVKEQKIDDARLVKMNGAITIATGTDATMDDSMSTLAQVTAGSINGIVTDGRTLTIARNRGYVNMLRDALPKSTLQELRGAWLDKRGEPTDKPDKAVALDLGKSKVWAEAGGPTDGSASLAVSNIVDDTARQRMLQLIDYLF